MSTQVSIIGKTPTGQQVAEADGYRYLLTQCCSSSGKGSDSPTGVVCRSCYEPVGIEFGVEYEGEVVA